MKLYVFSSYSRNNIWAGIGAKTWAVSLQQGKNKSIRTKAEKVSVGSFGLFYCNSQLTSPFMICSKPDQERIIPDIWPKQHSLPFSIFPFGTPDKKIYPSKLAFLLPSFKNKATDWKSFFHVQGITVFVESEINNMDWEVILTELSNI